MKKQKAFTLIEVMVVMAIIAVLAVLIIGAITIARHTATETTHRSNARTIQTGMEGYYAKNKAYPELETSCETASNATNLNVTLATGSSSSGTCATGGTYAGGCHVTSTKATYTITPANYNCTSGDELTGDELSI